MKQIKINEQKRLDYAGEGKTSFTIGIKDGMETVLSFLPGTSRSGKARIIRRERENFRARAKD